MVALGDFVTRGDVVALLDMWWLIGDVVALLEDVVAHCHWRCGGLWIFGASICSFFLSFITILVIL